MFCGRRVRFMTIVRFSHNFYVSRGWDELAKHRQGLLMDEIEHPTDNPS